MLREPNNKECDLCTNEGADLKSMNPQYYSWFKDYMLTFFEAPQKSPDGNKEPEQSMEAELKRFVRTFIEQERKKEDLRINDLGLRYKLESVREQLEGGHDLCRGNDTGDAHKLFPAFRGLLDGTGSDEKSEDRRGLVELNSRDYGSVMRKWKSDFRRHLQSSSNHGGHRKGLYLLGLKRWNSSSPAQGRSVGGGYLLYHTDENNTVDLGIAIDPGFDFVRNLFHEGFSISDIDIVLISHAHVDHIRDIESIVTLLSELGKKDERKKCVHVILSLGVYERLKHIIEDPFLRYHIDPYIIDARREIDPEYFENLSAKDSFHFVKLNKDEVNKRLMRYRAALPNEVDKLSSEKVDRIRINIQPTRAYHPDPSYYSDSFGFLITTTGLNQLSKEETKASGNDSITLGYTGDTKWVYPCVEDPLPSRAKRKIWDVSEQYVSCDAVIVHLGSLIDTDIDTDKNGFMNCKDCDKYSKQCEDLVQNKNHPYLVGLLRMLSTLYSNKKDGKSRQLVLVSEFGEELRGGIRRDLIERLKLAYKDALRFLPVDVGIDVQLWHKEKAEVNTDPNSSKQKVWCVQCGRFVAIDDAEFERYGVDEALFCVCRTCRKATPWNVLQDRLRQLYEVGHELRTIDE